jgi:hypothetical protein
VVLGVVAVKAGPPDEVPEEWELVEAVAAPT